jgi:hypothetical protein
MQNEIVVILGKKGSGKTVIARHLVKDRPRLVAYDPMRQFGACGVSLGTFEDILSYISENRRGPFRAIYQPEIPIGSTQDTVQQEFIRICDLVNRLVNVCFLVDEIDNCLPPRDRENGFFKNMIQRGRHAGVSLVATTIRYTDTQRNLTAQADKIVCFHTHEPSDIRYFKSYFGEMADDLPQLPPFHYIQYEKGQVSRHEPISI